MSSIKLISTEITENILLVFNLWPYSLSLTHTHENNLEQRYLVIG